MPWAPVRLRARRLTMTPTIRPMTTDDLEQVLDLTSVTFSDLDERFGAEPRPPGDRARRIPRFARPLATDPGGAWVAEDDGRIVGAAQAIDRDGLWGLSLLVVQPGLQSRGTGRALLDRALGYARGGRRGAIIVGWQDPRALRLYASAGFQLDPAVSASGHVRVPPAVAAGVREGGRGDL